MKPVTGYQGQNEINIAAERGEVQGNNTGLSNLTVNRADWLRDGKVRILLQYGAERLPALPGVPAVAELAGGEEDRALLRFYAVKFNMMTVRPFINSRRPSMTRCSDSVSSAAVGSSRIIIGLLRMTARAMPIRWR